MANTTGLAITGGADDNSMIEVYREDAANGCEIVVSIYTGEGDESHEVCLNAFEATMLATFLRSFVNGDA